MGPAVYNNTVMAVTLCKVDNANIEQGGAHSWCVVFLYTPTGNQPKRQQGLLHAEWSVDLLQLNVVVLVLHPTLPLKALVIKWGAHSKPNYPDTLCMIAACFLNCNYVYCNGQKLWIIRICLLYVCVFTCSDIWSMHRWMTKTNMALLDCFMINSYCNYTLERHFLDSLKWLFAAWYRDPVVVLSWPSQQDRGIYL